MNSIKLQHKMDTILMNFKNSKTSSPSRLLLNLSDKIDLQKEVITMLLSNLIIYYKRESIKKSKKNNKFEISAPTQIYKFELSNGSYSVSDVQDYYEYIIKKYETVADNPPIRIYLSKIQNRIKYKIKTGYYLQILTPETMKLLGSTISKITKDENGGNLSHLQITEVDQSIAILSAMIINLIQESCIHLFPINLFVNCQIFHLKINIFKNF